MPIHTPALFAESDVLTFRQTPASEYRIPYTFVESLNEGILFDRSARTFEEAARTQRLYDVVVGEDQRIIGAGMLGIMRRRHRGVTRFLGRLWRRIPVAGDDRPVSNDAAASQTRSAPDRGRSLALTHQERKHCGVNPIVNSAPAGGGCDEEAFR
jgi:hypothetical protein